MSDGYQQYDGMQRDYRRPAAGEFDDAKTAGMIVVGCIILLAVMGGGFRKLLKG